MPYPTRAAPPAKSAPPEIHSILVPRWALIARIGRTACAAGNTDSQCGRPARARMAPATRADFRPATSAAPAPSDRDTSDATTIRAADPGDSAVPETTAGFHRQ